MRTGAVELAGGVADALAPITFQRSLIDTTYDRLVDAIATDRLPPGTRLNQRDLADQLMVSRQPISHALHRLKASGLAVQFGRKGLIVAPMDQQRLHDLYELRTEIEGLVGARAAANVRDGQADPADVDRLRELMRQGESITAETSVLDCIALDVAFHLCLYRLSASEVIGEAIAPLWPHFRRAMGRALIRPSQRKISWNGHHAIASAIYAGDPDAAKAASREHIRQAGDLAVQDLAAPSDQGA